MAELIDVANAMFKNREKWKDITDDEKIKFFFIFNRYFCKRYPSQAQLLNNKSIDSVSAMDTWFIFSSSIPYPKWFWSKSKSTKIKSEISEDEIIFLMTEYDLKRDDLDIIIKFYPEIVKEEIKWYRDSKKSNK
jgi:hypothetical protein